MALERHYNAMVDNVRVSVNKKGKLSNLILYLIVSLKTGEAGDDGAGVPANGHGTKLPVMPLKLCN